MTTGHGARFVLIYNIKFPGISPKSPQKEAFMSTINKNTQSLKPKPRFNGKIYFKPNVLMDSIEEYSEF